MSPRVFIFPLSSKVTVEFLINPLVPSNLAKALLVDETKETACIFVVTSAVPSKEDLVAPLN